MAILAIIFSLTPAIGHSQGCTQCKDNTAALPAETRAAYRHAIFTLAGAGTAIFLLTVLALRRGR